MTRVEAERYYYFPPWYFTELRESLGGHLHLCIVEIDGQVASAGLFTEICGIVQYHLSGTRDAFLKYCPLKSMFNFMRYWAKDRGDRIFHLGGGVGGRGDTLFEFKAGFSHARHPFYTWRIIVDEPAYSALVGRWESLARIQADGPEGFFPAYRKSYSSQGASSPGCLEVDPSLRVDHCRELERPGDAQEREHDPGESGAHRESEASRHGTAYQAPA